MLVESTVSELRGGRRLRVVASPVERALAIGMRVAGEDAVQLDGSAVLVDAPPERMPDVVRALVTEGLDVHEATVSERTLEEVFFEMTDTGLHPQAATTLEAVR